MEKIKISKSIFRAYDIRGEYPEEVNKEIFFYIGQSLAKILKKNAKTNSARFLKQNKTVVIGRDMRKGSAQLAQALSMGILSEGLNVDYLGMCTTPMASWTVAKKEYLGGAMITASHNPSKHNGVKMWKSGAMPIRPEEIWAKIPPLARRSLSLASEGGYCHAEVLRSEGGSPLYKGGNETSKRAALQRKSYIEEYIKFIKSFYNKNSRHLKIVVDASWAMASEEIPFIFNGLNIDFIPLCFGPIENFSDREINPLNRGALLDLSKLIRKNKADLGVAFDGDEDRAVFVDENGEPVDQEIISAILISEILKKSAKNKIVVDARAGKISLNPIEAGSGKTIISKIGRPNIIEAMTKNSAAFGSESSGHYYFKESFYSDNAMIAMLKIMNILGSSDPPATLCKRSVALRAGEKFSAIASKFKIRQKSIELNFKTSGAVKQLKNIENHFKKSFKKEISISHLDGLTIEHADWRFNIRQSNTEKNILRLNAEGEDEKILRWIIGKVKELL